MAENRYHLLLGLPEDQPTPDYYQLLELVPTDASPDSVGSAFKVQMNKLQHIESPKHKEFIEFLKGEVRKARKVLSDADRRRKYDAEIKEDRIKSMKQILSHLLLDKKLSTMEEVSLIAEGQKMGLDKNSIAKVIEDELVRTGSKRVKSSASDSHTQVQMNTRVHKMGEELENARLESMLALARAKRAEMKEKKASEAQKAAQEREKRAMERMRQAIVDKNKTQARGPKEPDTKVRRKINEKDQKIKELQNALKVKPSSPGQPSPHFGRTAIVLLLFFVALTALAAAFEEQVYKFDQSSLNLTGKFQTSGPGVKITVPVVAVILILIGFFFLSRRIPWLAYVLSPVGALILMISFRMIQ